MDNQIIVLKQLPIIEERMAQEKALIEQRVAEIMRLPVTEETRQDAKKAKAALNAEFKEYEERRKQVKDAILGPYNAFEAVYKECIAEPYRTAEAVLKERIAVIEDGIKEQKTVDIEAYFEELRSTMNLPDGIGTFQQTGFKVGLSTSVKKMREAATVFLENIKEDVQHIRTLEHADEILLEYRQCLNVSQAAGIVNDRHRRITEEKQRREQAAEAARVRAEAQARTEAIFAQQETEEQQAAEIEELEPLTPPVIEEPQQKQVFTTTFTVKGTLAQLKALKTFLEDGGYEYE